MDKRITVRLKELHMKVLQELIDSGAVKNQSEAIQYLINKYGILGGK